MRFWCVVFAVVIAITTVGADTATDAGADTAAVAADTANHTGPLIKVARNESNEKGNVTVIVHLPGDGVLARALQELILLVVQKRTEVAAVPANESIACFVSDTAACWTDTVFTMHNKAFHQNDKDHGGGGWIAIVPIGASFAPDAWKLQENGLNEMDQILPLYRRACVATAPPARSLLDLTDSAIASKYHIPDELIPSDQRLHIDFSRDEWHETCGETLCNGTLTPDWCKNTNCATLLTSSDAEAQVMWREVRARHLYASVQPLGRHLANVTSHLSSRSIIACDGAPEIFGLGTLKAATLGPPPCLSGQPCSFETRRIAVFIDPGSNLKLHARYLLEPIKILKTKEKLQKFVEDAYFEGPVKAARMLYETLTFKSIIRIDVLQPGITRQETYNGQALSAAAAVFEDDMMYGLFVNTSYTIKVRLKEDQCLRSKAQKHMYPAIHDYGVAAMSAIAGPPCGTSWSEVAQTTSLVHIPMLAFTQQSPTTASYDLNNDRFQILAAGDAREGVSALASFMGRFGWRRLAALSETGTRPLIDAMRMHAKIDVHLELQDYTSVDVGAIEQWALKVAKENARIIYLCVEDARVYRAALCAARAHGLTVGAGVVWLLCYTPPAGWLNATNNTCTNEELKEMAEGYFTVTPEWSWAWQHWVRPNTTNVTVVGPNSTNDTDDRTRWEQKWYSKCMTTGYTIVEGFSGHADRCGTPAPYVAMLYDVLMQWALALYDVLQQDSSRINRKVLFQRSLQFDRYLISKMTSNNTFEGLTGNFTYTAVDGAYARNGSTILSQWNSKTGAQKVGTWTNGSLELDNSTLKWYTKGGEIPDDGTERCALQTFADTLHADCRTAYVALASLLVAILIVVLAGTALHCKKRAEKEYRKRLQALGMRPLANKLPGLDRWEIPRERVVINRKLGTGAFGTVYGGHALLAEDRGWSAVAVKTLKAGANTEEKLDFLSEAESMKRFDHKNVVRLLGVVTKTEPVCTVMEFMLYGDLKNYLLARRHLAMGSVEEESEGGEVDEASPRRLTSMAVDVARALSYLAQLRYVHRDVAARNCLVSARRVVKLADFGMTRLVFENDYYRFSRKGLLPVRWMAPESLALGVFSPASDVWSFGVLLYEIVTFGSLPFQGLSNSEVLGRVKGGRTLDLPPGLKPQLEGLIKSCWQHDPKARPMASEVAAFLADAPRLLTPCLDVPLDAMPLDSDPPWRLPRDQAEARWVSWAAPASATTDTTYLSTDGAVPLDTDSFLP